jgi:prepilin-type N-terminal cleavage/methylation domain-containing protein
MAGPQRCRLSGFSLAEMTISVAIIAVIAVVALPSMTAHEPNQLDLAAEEVASALRLAVSESRRLGATGTATYILVDGKTDINKLHLYVSNGMAQISPSSEIKDPLIKMPAPVDTSTGHVLKGITLTPLFNGGGQPRPQLLITQNPAQFKVFDGTGNDHGMLQPNSGVQLSLGANTVTVSFNELTGLVARP